MDLIPTPDQVVSAAANVAHKVLYGGLADLRPMPRTLIDEGVLRQIARAANGGALSFHRRPGPGRATWSFSAYGGEGSRSFRWVPARPGAHLLRDVAPLLALLIILIGGLAALVLRRARKAARELLASETKALYIASRDSLTGLPNRRAFGTHLLDLGRRGERQALMFLDLDGFKKVNDTFGHAAGDCLLRIVGERISAAMEQERTFRLGGDEFAILLRTPESLRDLERTAERVLLALAEPGDCGGHVVIPVNCPPVMFRTWPWTKFDHGEQRKNTPPAASCGVPGRPIGISIEAIPRSWSGMPSWTFSPPISITLDSSLEAVRRVSM